MSETTIRNIHGPLNEAIERYVKAIGTDEHKAAADDLDDLLVKYCDAYDRAERLDDQVRQAMASFALIAHYEPMQRPEEYVELAKDVLARLNTARARGAGDET